MKFRINYNIFVKNPKIFKIIRNIKIAKTTGLLAILSMLSTVGSINYDYVQANASTKVTNTVNREKTINELINSKTLLSLGEMNKAANGLGKFVTKGMKESDYKKALKQEWIEIEPVGNPKKEIFDISKYYKWIDVEKFIENLAKYDNVKLYVIGKSVEKRNIYALEVGTGDKIIVLTGSVHARETAGTSYILRQLSELLTAVAIDDYYKMLLEEYKIVAVPCVNPDGRAILEKDQGSYWKANANGVDLNRNFPSANTGQLKKGNKQQPNFSTKPSSEFFPGYTLGSEPETKAMMSLFNKYVKQTIIFLDYHQAGRVIYAGKTSNVKEATEKSKLLANDLIKFMASDGGYKYRIIEDVDSLKGIGGGTLTDYFSQLASGLEFSSAFGRLGLRTNDGILTTMFYEDIDKKIEYYKPLNTEFACATIEIGNMNSRHYTKESRLLQEKEYELNRYDEMLVFLLERDYKNRYGKNALSELKNISNNKKHSLKR